MIAESDYLCGVKSVRRGYTVAFYGHGNHAHTSGDITVKFLFQMIKCL